MRRFVVLSMLLLTLALAGCSEDYKVNLTLVNPPSADGLTFEDDAIRFVIQPQPANVLLGNNSNRNGLVFRLYSKSPQTLRIIWRDAAFVMPDGSTSRVIHYEMATRNVTRSMAADRDVDAEISGVNVADGIIPAKAFIEEGVIPTANMFKLSQATMNTIAMIAGSIPTKAEWSAKDLIPPSAEYNGKMVSLVMPIESDGLRHEYRFDIRVDVTQSPPPPATPIEAADPA